MRTLINISLLLLITSTVHAGVTAATCQPFYDALEQVPHESIFQREGMFNSRFFETSATGCFLVMNTTAARLGEQKLPDLSARPGTPLHAAGWRANQNYTADGPGTAVIGLEKEEALCIVYSDQPSYRNDDGKIARGIFIKVQVECMEGVRGNSPKMILLEGKPAE